MNSKQTATELNVVSVDTQNGRVTLRRDGAPLAARIKAILDEARIAKAFLESHKKILHSVEREGWIIEGVEGAGENHLSIKASAVVEGHRVDYNLRIGAPTEEWAHTVGDVRRGIYRSAPPGHVMSPELALRLSEENEARARRRLEDEVYRYLLAQCELDEEPDPDEVKSLLEECWSKEVGPTELDCRIVGHWLDDGDKVFRIELESSDGR